jgi:Kef-type K+ transport system membrane component KefB
MIAVLVLLALAGLMHATRSFGAGGAAGVELAFGFLLLAAFFAARLTSRLGFPKLTGYLAAGIVAGPYVLGLVDEDMTTHVKVVSDVAVCMIALTAGAELNVTRIRPLARTLRAMTLYAVVGAMFAIGGVLFAIRPLLPWLDAMPFDQALAVSLMIGVALSAQSPAVVMALISEMRSEGPVTSVMLASVVVADLVVIVCYAIASAVTGAIVGGGIDVSETLMTVGWELFGSILFGGAIGALLGTFLANVSRGASLFAVLVCLVVAEIGARVHLDPLIVMIAAGLWLENVSRANAHRLLDDFESAQLPVFLVFFALAGSHIDVHALYASIAPIAILALTRIACFFVGCRVATARTHAAPTIRRYAWFGLVPQAGLALAIAILVQRSFPSFGGSAAVILFGVVGFNEMTAPVVLRRLILRSGEAGKRPARDFAAGH